MHGDNGACSPWPPPVNDLSLFLPCAAGVEDFLAQEVHRRCAGDDLRVLRAGVRVRAAWRDVLALNLKSRLAAVLVELAHRPYRAEQDLYEAASGVAWGLVHPAPDLQDRDHRHRQRSRA